MERWGAVLNADRKRNENTSISTAPGTDVNRLEDFGISVPARGLFTLKDAQPASFNQRELLAAILGLETFLPSARSLHVNLASDAQVALTVVKNWASCSPRIMVLLRILRKLCEGNGISLACDTFQAC
jgi:hypothetical protein